MMKGRSKKPPKKSYGFGRSKKESEQDVSKNDRLIGDLINDLDLLEELAVKLDSTHHAVQNWNHLALVLDVSPRDIESLQGPVILGSPSWQLIKYLSVSHPSLTVRQFKQALQTIQRNDAVATLNGYIFLKTTGEYIGDVLDEQDLMVYLTALLDKESRGLIKNWKDLAQYFGIPRKDIIRFEQPKAMESPTKHLLEYVAAMKPHLTLNHFKSALHEIHRRDLVAIIDNYFDTSKVPVRENVLSEPQQITWDTKVMDAKNVSSNMERIAVKRGFKVSDKYSRSGDCMFYALSEQLERVKKIRIPHDEVRKRLILFLRENPTLPDGTELFNFVGGFPSWASYLEHMEREGRWGDHIMLYAAANRYEVSIRVISLSLERSDVVIVPGLGVVDPRQLIIGHLPEFHYVSLLPQKVPAEVLARGALAWEAYKEALAEGSTRVMRLPIMVIGQYRSGKTSLIKSLKEEKFNPFEEPTDRIEKDPNLFGFSRNLWSIEDKTELDSSYLYEDRVGKEVASILRNKENQESNEMTDPKYSDQWKNTGIDPRPTEADDTDLKRVIQGQSPTPEERKKERVAEQTLPEKIEASIRKHLEQPEEKDSEKICAVVWDFAGQLVFYATHPIFLSPRAIFLLVSNLSWNPEDRASPVVHQQRFSRKEDKDCIKTNADYLDLWFSSVSCLAEGSTTTEKELDEMLPEGLEGCLPDQLPPVILVCTHADCLYDASAEPNDLALKTYGLLKGKPYSDHLFKDFFTVNNKKSGGEEKCPEVQRLKKAITAIAHQLPHVKQDIPIKWLTFEKALQSRKESRHCISLEEARQIARECEINDDQHTHVLNFLHDQRSVIHFDESEVMKNLVILDVDWLIKVFKKVITVKRYDGKSAHEEKLWEKLQTEGILADELLRIVWNDLQDGESSESLIAIMEKFGLLFPWPSGKEYFVPSVLMSPPEEKVTKLLASAHFPSLFIRFKQPPSQNCSGSGEVRYAPVPLGFFSRLILRFIQWCAEKQSNPSRPKLFQDFANFLVYPDEKCHVVLLRRFSFIELVVLKANPPERSQVKITPSDTDVCSSLRRKLKDMLTSMQKDFCWMKNVEYELSMLCPVCCKGGSFTHCRKHTDCKQEECLHFWSEGEFCKSVEPCCEHTLVFTSESISLEAFKPWFIVSDGKEQSTFESLLSFKDSLLSDIIGDVNVMDELARQLDQPICHGERETPSGKYWLHLAKELGMPFETLIKCQHSFENSPSKFLFEHKESLSPEFTVQNLKDRLAEIPRNDLVNRLDGCRLSDTATLDDLREKHKETFEISCLQLDHFNDWQALGKKIGISNEKLKQIKTSSSCAETVLGIIEKKNPNVTVKDMCVLSVEMERQDVCEELKKLPDPSTIVDLRSNLDCLEKVAIKLDQETPGLKNWYYFGWKCDIPIADLDSLKPKRNPSPTKRMIEYIVQAEPHLTVRSLIQKLKRIERLDVVTALKEIRL